VSCSVPAQAARAQAAASSDEPDLPPLPGYELARCWCILLHRDVHRHRQVQSRTAGLRNLLVPHARTAPRRPRVMADTHRESRGGAVRPRSATIFIYIRVSVRTPPPPRVAVCPRHARRLVHRRKAWLTRSCPPHPRLRAEKFLSRELLGSRPLFKQYSERGRRESVPC
jgi:hypothetical protein